MGLDDEREKLKQAAEWATSPDATPEQAKAAAEFIRHTLQFTSRGDLRAQAFQILQQIQSGNAGRL